jgi:transcription antitermination factor NusG
MQLTHPGTLVPLIGADCATWFAVQTRSRHEKLVACRLEGEGVDTFLPLLTQVHRWSDRRKTVQVPLFAGYAFVRVPIRPEIRLKVLQTDGVLSFVGVRGVGTPIPDDQIDGIRKLLASDIACTEYPFLKVGQRVRIRGGALDGITGILASRSGGRSLVISVEPIERSLAISIEGYDVEPC